MKIFSRIFLSISIILILSANSYSEEKCCPVSLNIGADIMSRYIFRGVDYGNSPSIQPTLSLKAGGFEIGYWGAISVNSFYQESDLYLKYTLSNFSIGLTDYYIPSIVDAVPASPDTRYFCFDDKKTSHTLEATLSYQGPEKFPFWVSANIFFYGNDKRWGYDEKKDIDEETYYSSYFEIGYTFNIEANKLNVWCGLTPSEGAFGNTFGVVNLGFSGTKNIKISNEFELPVKAAVIYNPQQSIVNYVFGFSL